LVALWNLLVRVSSIVGLDEQLWLLGIVAILAISTVDLLVERWGSVLNFTIEFDIDSKAHQSSSDSLVEEANEELSCDQSVDNDEDHGDPNGRKLMAFLVPYLRIK
jgi:hypothetical protein